MNVFDLNPSGSGSRRVAESVAAGSFVSQSVAPARRAWPFAVKLSPPLVKSVQLACTVEPSLLSSAHLQADPAGPSCSFVS